jgi:hypothetical protein
VKRAEALRADGESPQKSFVKAITEDETGRLLYQAMKIAPGGEVKPAPLKSRISESLNLSGFSRINLVVGDNAAGKTSFLEALFAAGAGSAEIGSRFRIWRGLEISAISPLQELYDGLFLSMFFNLERGRVGTVSIKGSLRFYYDTGEPVLLPITDANQLRVISQSYTPVAFEWKDPNGALTKSILQYDSHGIRVVGNAIRSVDPTFLPARMNFNSGENAKWFSSLKQEGSVKKFIKAARDQIDDVEDLSTEIEFGGPSIFVKYKKHDRLMPVALASDGMNKLMTVLLHIAHSTGTATFIDEIENGFHFSRHEGVTEKLLEFAKEYDTQVFAPTHSSEFLRLSLPMIQKNAQDFTLIRVFRHEGKGGASLLQGSEAAIMHFTERKICGMVRSIGADHVRLNQSGLH